MVIICLLCVEYRLFVLLMVSAPRFNPSPLRPVPSYIGQAGFVVDEVWLVPRPTILPAGTGMRGWLSTFTQAFLNAIPEDSSSESETHPFASTLHCCNASLFLFFLLCSGICSRASPAFAFCHRSFCCYCRYCLGSLFLRSRTNTYVTLFRALLSDCNLPVLRRRLDALDVDGA